MQGTKKPRSPVRLVLVDDNPGVLETVGRLLEVDFEVQGKFASGAAALREIPRLEPDIAILDVAWAICRDLRWCGSCTAQGADRNSSSCRCWRGRKWCKARSLRARRDMCTSRESPPDLVEAIAAVSKEETFSSITGWSGHKGVTGGELLWL